MAGMPYPPKCVLWAVHLCLVGAAETAAPLTFRPSSTSEINDYGYAPGWRLQPKPIVLARRPLLRHGRPA